MVLEVKTTSGVVTGADSTEHGGVHAFLGIPYAASPTGERRLFAPAPPEPWDGVRLCSAYGASAPQPEQGFTIIPEPITRGDNCLNLNVFTPDAGRGAGGMPVLVWIHGGGFTNGCNASPWYHGRGFGADGIVVVAVNYRLGMEGFLPLPGAPANRAVLDWLAALEWVQDNIAAFGGDPDNVTIAGQSAGSVACATLLAVPRAAGMFRRAILMSGGVSHLRDLDEGMRFAGRVANELGVAATRDAFATIDPMRLVELQPMRAAAPTAKDTTEHPVVHRYRNLLGGMRFAPVVDGDVVPEAPIAAVRDGAARDVDLLIGTTAEEVDRVGRFDGVDDDIAQQALEALGMTAAEASAYRAAVSPGEPARVLGRATSDGMFRVPAMRLLEATAGPRCHGYEFRWRSPTGFGAVHCLDIPFAFDVLDADKVSVVAGDEPPRSLAEDIHGAWVSFLRDGSLPWAGYGLETRNVMVFDAPQSHVEADPHEAARAAFGRLI